MKTKLLNIKNEKMYPVLLFLFTVFYNLFIVRNFTLPDIGVAVRSFHTVDFTVGFCTKILPGAVFNLLPGKCTDMKIIVYETILLLLFFAAVSVFLGRFISSASEENKGTALFLSILFLSGPCTFSIYAYRVGMLDVYWVFLAAAAVFMLRNKYLRWGMPLICIAAILIHISAMIAYIILFAMLLLYEYISAEDKKEKRTWGIIFLLSVGVSVLTFGYFLLFEKSNLVFTMEEFDAWLAGRGAGGYYYDYALYGHFIFDDASFYNFNEVIVPIGFSPLIERFVNKIIQQILFNFTLFVQSNIPPYVMLILIGLVLPLLLPVYKFALRKMRENKKDKPTVFFCVCLFAQFPFTLLCAILTSVDVTRWTAHAFTVLFTLFLYMLYKEGDEALSAVREYGAGFPGWMKAVYSAVYALTVFDPYC